jgi:integrase
MAHRAEAQQPPRRKGSVFQNGSATWWIKFSERGIARRENSHSSDRRVAEKLLQRRLAEVTTVTYIPRENIRVDELISDLLEEHKVNGRKSTSDVEARWRLHLLPFFTRRRAMDITTDLIRRYVSLRQAEDAENATINRELSLLKRAFNLGRECTPPKVRIVPYIPMLKELNVRKGFFESEHYQRLTAECAQVGLWMRALFELGFTYGWRDAELKGLRVQQVNLLAGTIRLDPGTTKNDDGREVVMTKPVRELLTQCVHGKGPDDYVFTRNNGTRIADFRGT